MLYLTGEHYYIVKYTRTVTNLMPSTYKTKCFDYNQIGCKSRQDCISKFYRTHEFAMINFCYNVTYNANTIKCHE